MLSRRRALSPSLALLSYYGFALITSSFPELFMARKQTRHFFRVFITTFLLLAVLIYIGRHQEPPQRHGRAVPASCEDLHVDPHATSPLRKTSHSLWRHCSVRMSDGMPVPD